MLLPRQASTKTWTLRQRRSLDTLLSASKAARLVHKAVANAEPVPELRPGGVQGGAAAALTRVEADVAAARAALDAHVAPALETRTRLERDSNALARSPRLNAAEEEDEERAWRVSACALATGELRETLRVNFATTRKSRDVVEGVFASAAAAANFSACPAPNGSGDAEAFAVLPGWEPLRTLLRKGARDAETYASECEEARREAALLPAPAAEKAKAEKAEAVAAAATRFAVAAEAGVGAALVWAQTVKRASDGDAERPADDAAEQEHVSDGREEASVPTMVGAELRLRAAMSPSKLVAAATRVEEACAALAELSDAARSGLDSGLLDSNDACVSVAAAAAARAAELAPLLALVGAAFRRAFAAYLHFHRASAKLEAVLSSLAVGVCLEGFCARPEEDPGAGEGEEGGKMMDDVAGTGMGAGEGKKDVSDEIEDEEQILGQEDMEKGDDDGGEKKDDAKGIEMQNDFEADARALSDDDEKNENDEEKDDEDGENENGDDIEKEMGDGEDDENAEVIDEKVWDQDDEDEEKDKPKDEKNEKQDKYEKGSSVKARDAMETETRAADEDEDEDREDRDKNAEKDREDKKEDKSKDEKDEDPPDEPAPEEDPNANDEPKDENDGVNREEIEENHGVAPKGAEGSDDEELDLPDDMQLDGEDEAQGEGEDDENNEDGDDGRKMDDDVDDGEKGDGPGDADDDGADDEADGGELDRVMEEVEGDEEKEEEEAGGDDENAGGAADDDDGAEENDEGVQGGPSGAGGGGGLGDDDDEKNEKTDAGDRGGDASAGAEGDEEAREDPNQGGPDRSHAPAPTRFEDADLDDGDDEELAPPDRNQSALEAPGGGGQGGGGGASASAAGDGAAAPMADGAPPPGGGGAPPPSSYERQARERRREPAPIAR